MRIKKDRLEEFAVWMAYMRSSGELTAISFFNYLCFCNEKGSDVVKLISNALELGETSRPCYASNNEIYMAMCSFSDFHEGGDDFRFRWNTAIMNSGYAKYIEEGVIKHVVQPFASHSIFDTELFAESDDDEEDSGMDDSWEHPDH